jgi:branched-chain amino acid transport system ATP-binding protein
MTLLQVRGLSKRFGGLVATDALDLDVESGEIHAVIGPNGAGKTTLISQLSGALAPDAGSIVLKGQDVTALSVHERVQRGIARSYQVTNVFRALSALDNVVLAVQAGDGSSFGFWRPVREERHLYERAHELLHRVGLHQRGDVLAGALAHGEQRQLEVALALATRPRLLLLDEPMAGMGPDESARMVTLIEELRDGLTIILIEHDMDAVFRLADRISVLVYGRVLATGRADAVRSDPVVRQAYLGTETA